MFQRHPHLAGLAELPGRWRAYTCGHLRRDTGLAAPEICGGTPARPCDGRKLPGLVKEYECTNCGKAGLYYFMAAITGGKTINCHGAGVHTPPPLTVRRD